MAPASHPVLWTFRRCPYAIRARLALIHAGLRVEAREIALRDKPEAFLAASPSATVPALHLPEGVLDESLEIMVWALDRHDPTGLRDMPEDGWALIAANDGPFKRALDGTKYPARHPDQNPQAARDSASAHLRDLDARLRGRAALFGRATLADLALLPFVRQFAAIDPDWFTAQGWPDLAGWLARGVQSQAFEMAMVKQPLWSPGDPPRWFGA